MTCSAHLRQTRLTKCCLPDGKRHTEVTLLHRITKQHMINKNKLKRYRKKFASIADTVIQVFYKLAMALAQPRI